MSGVQVSLLLRLAHHQSATAREVRCHLGEKGNGDRFAAVFGGLYSHEELSLPKASAHEGGAPFVRIPFVASTVETKAHESAAMVMG